jgi:hypothetical protein
MSPCLPLSPSPHLPLTKSPAHPLSLSSYPPFFQPSILPIFQKQMPPKASLETRKKIYQSLCYVLSDRAGQIAWDEFTPADWKLFSQMAEREGVAPLMYWKLKDSPVAVPLSTFNLLRSTYYQTLAQNTLMYQELERILTALDEAGIAVIVLKGAALAATVYEDIGLRPMGDLDLLVREEEFQEALDVLLSIGYMQEPMPHQEFNRQIGYNVHLWRESNPILKVELHWLLVAGGDVWFGSSMEWLSDATGGWESRVDRLLYRDFNNVLELSFEASLLYMSAHLMLQHGLEQARLLWFFDIHQLIGHAATRANWEKLVEHAQGSQWTSALRATLTQTHLLLETTLPEEVISDLSQRESLSSKDEGLFQNQASRVRTKAADVWGMSSFLKPGNRMKYAINMVIPSRQYMRWRYNPRPVWLWPLCYPYRWVRMMREALLTLSKLLIRNRVDWR